MPCILKACLIIGFIIVIAPVIIPLLAIVLICWCIKRFFLTCAMWFCWSSRGIDVLFVYSNSPNWQSHIEEEALPFIRKRAIVLNWSERKKWRSGLAMSAFRHFGGDSEFNPLSLVFKPFQTTRVFRFWQPFRDWKHGKVEPLQRLESEFFEMLGIKKIDQDQDKITPAGIQGIRIEEIAKSMKKPLYNLSVYIV